ncbi:MAG: 30S ribosomal protein S4e [Thaumarchaeota archaeon]|nr:30S ribosomal protein S4e [Nitrososphaerota archaeon]MCY3975654.1 30S ribosomal protein S4e [Nitrososphaerota archaeon]
MTRIAGSKKLKRQMAPIFWGLNRKSKRFAITVKPGPHKKNYSIPTPILLRDILRFVSTLKEAKFVIYNGKVIIDGLIRKSLHHGIGLMDVIELQNISSQYRMIPLNGKILAPIKIPSEEKSKKIVKVITKSTIKNNKFQIGTHDGRTIITNLDIKVGDSCLINIPDQKILDVLKLENTCKVLIIKGINAGKIGTVENIKKGTFLLSKQVTLNIGNQKIEIPFDLIMVIGKDKPVLKSW